MKTNFHSINYLATGNNRQQQAYQTLQAIQIMEVLAAFQPTLVGTVPIDIDIEDSDLDIICTCDDHELFRSVIGEYFGHMSGYTTATSMYRAVETTVAQFRTPNFILEIFGQATPIHQQYAYRHMLIEHEILMREGAAFREEIRRLKRAGIKTEPAFAQLLGLTGDPYEALLAYENTMTRHMDDMTIRQLRADEALPLELLLLADPSEDMIRSYVTPGTCYVADHNDTIVGAMVVIEIADSAAEIKNIAVHPSYQGMGIGTKLISHAIHQCTADDYHELKIATGNTSIHQLRLYQKMGFVVETEIAKYFIDNYPEPIYEHGQQCTDLIILSMNLSK